MMSKRITSMHNDEVKLVVKLKDGKHRRSIGLAVAEGDCEVEAAISAGIDIVASYYIEGRRPSYFDDQAVEVAEDVMKKMSMRENPGEGLVVFRTPLRTINDIAISDRSLILVLEAVEKPGNLGAMVRTAYAAGADAVILCDARADIYNPNAIRASRGMIFQMPVIAAETDKTINWLAKHNIISLAATPSADMNHFDFDLTRPVALVLGTESEGLSRKWLEEANDRIRIEMVREIDSLNVSVTAGILLFEAARQRRD